jgi:hypothetical protein
LPVEPTIEYRREDTNIEHEFFAIVEDLTEMKRPAETHQVTVTLRKARTQNWGYDVPILGRLPPIQRYWVALRPDEIVDFIATLHNFSGGRFS